MSWTDVVVVGGSGFIGSRLCARLESSGMRFAVAGRSVGTTSPRCYIAVDVLSSRLAEALPETTAIINLAAEHRDDVHPVQRYDDVNVGGARSVCKAAACRGVRMIVFVSSAAVYGPTARGVGEDATPNPASAYARSKLAAEAVYRRWQAGDAGRRALVIVRPVAVFGERGAGNINLMLSKMAASRLPMVGDGRNVRSLAYVENVASFIHFALAFAPGVHVYNYVDKPDMTVGALVAFVRRCAGVGHRRMLRIPYRVAHTSARLFDVASVLTGRRLPISSTRVEKFCADSQFETSVAETGFVPPVTLQDGLAATVRQLLCERRNAGRG